MLVADSKSYALLVDLIADWLIEDMEAEQRAQDASSAPQLEQDAA
ncbi:MAG: hypothetical protein ABI859_16540 [Pseudomonadota bacterium]